MKIVDLKCAVLGRNPIVRLVTDEGIDGFAAIESYKPDQKPHVLAFRDALIGKDPTNVERVMLTIRQRGAFKPWGSAVSAIEMALWDVAGKAAGLPVHKLLGGKVRDHVRIYNGALRGAGDTFVPGMDIGLTAETFTAKNQQPRPVGKSWTRSLIAVRFVPIFRR